MMTDALVHCQQATFATGLRCRPFFARADTRTKISTLFFGRARDGIQ